MFSCLIVVFMLATVGLMYFVIPFLSLNFPAYGALVKPVFILVTVFYLWNAVTKGRL